MILVTAAGKGGVGKTTTAATLYSAAKRYPFKTRLVDLDPYGTLHIWLNDPSLSHPEIGTAAELTALDEPDGLLIVDTPASLSAEQSIAAVQAADVLIGCSGASAADLGGLGHLGKMLDNGAQDIDLVAITKFDSRINHNHAALQLAQRQWGASRVIVFPYRSEVVKAFDEGREVAPSSPLALAASDLLARVLELKQADNLRSLSHA